MSAFSISKFWRYKTDSNTITVTSIKSKKLSPFHSSLFFKPFRFFIIFAIALTLTACFGESSDPPPADQETSLDRIRISSNSTNLTSAGETVQLTVTGEYSNGSTQDLTSSSTGTTYTSSDTSVATVSIEGLVTAISNGSTTITPSNKGKTATLEIRVDIPVVMLTVPDAVGMSQSLAEATVVAAGLAVGTVTTTNSDTVPDGEVISQSPAGGTSVLEGSSVDLVVSLGPVMLPVPDVVGTAQSSAEAAIVSANLTVGTVTTANSDTVPAGDVISQSPSGGTSVLEGSSVDLVVSLGPVMVTVPDVVGTTQSSAEAAIVAANLTVGTVTTANSDTVPAGEVISQSPAGGTSAAEGSSVDLVVSLGPVMVTVPDVVGMDQSSAEASIVSANLTVGTVTTANSDTVPAGEVISQSPSGGTSVLEGSSVDLVVSLGPVMVTVPDVVGMDQSSAEAAIVAANLTVGTVTTANSDTVPAGEVISQSPSGGTSVLEGSSVDLVVSLGPVVLPPDPEDVATEIDTTVATTMTAATAFLYTGTDPIQTGVASDTIEPVRVAVLRGMVKERDGNPILGVTVTILDHSEFGQTLTRTDGMFDITVNGGGYLTVDYRKSGYLHAQRQLDVPWQDYIWLPDMIMIPVDPQITTIDLTSSDPMQVAMGSVVTDSDGTRQAVLMIPQGTTAEITLPDGTTQSLSTLNLRATEYTVGDNGPDTMPAPLPPTSGYTYAVELSADEALANGIKVNGKDVVFNQPVPSYVDNFLNFPVGTIVPVGYYDNDKGAWIPYDNGLVIGIVGVTGGFADVDVDGDGSADTGTVLSDLNITDEEREQLAALYSPGQSMWRVQLAHLSTWDYNWPYGPPPNAKKPPKKKKKKKPDKPCKDTGSIIECQNQTIGERVPVTGTGFTLNYRSDRVPGYLDSYTLEIPLSESSVPASLLGITLEVSVAGQEFRQSFPPNPDQTYSFTWDGMDAYGRTLQGTQPVSISTGYVYEAVYLEPAELEQAFGNFSGTGIAMTGDPGRQEITIWQEWQDTLGTLDAKGQSLGGWTLDLHHAYDPIARVLYLGDGSRRSAESVNSVIDTVAGNGTAGYGGDSGPATDAQLAAPRDVAVGPDGSIYIADSDNERIRRVTPDGIISTVAGNGTSGYSGDSGPATDAQLANPIGVAVGPNGSIYIADGSNHCIRRVTTDGIINTVAGNGTSGYSGDSGPATDAQLAAPWGVAVGPDGSFYIADTVNNRIRRVGPDGIINTVAGNGTLGYSGDSGPATDAQLVAPRDVAVGPDGSIYIADDGNSRIRRVTPDGIITTVAGNGTKGYSGDGGPATDAQLLAPRGVAVGPDGSIYIADFWDYRIRRVGPDGIINTMAGNGTAGYGGDSGLAASATLDRPIGPAVGPDGSIYIADLYNNRVRRVAPPLPDFTAEDIVIPSEDGSELYRFDSTGRHLKTLNALTGAGLYDFNYDTDGLLTGIVDGDGNSITINRDADGNPTAIVAYGGQTTDLVVNVDGYLESITNPADEATTLTYGNEGLLATFTDARGNASRFTYDALGRLTLTEDAAGGSKSFSRTEDDTGYTVTKTTAMGRVTTYQIEYLPTGEERSYKEYPDGAWNEVLLGTDGASTITNSNGTVVTTKHGPDPRFGMLVPVLESLTITTPGGVISTMTQSRTATLADPHDPLSLLTLENTVTVNGRTTTYVYDAVARSLTTTTPEGRQTISFTDELGRVTSVDLAAGVDPITTSYDAQGLITQVSQGIQSWIYAYDSLNRIISRIDAAGNETAYSYDDADRTIQLDLPGGGVQGYGYDANGNLTQVVMPSLDVHALGYTLRDFLESYTPPNNTSFTRSYDLDQAFVSRTLPSGRVVTNSFDAGSGQWTSTSYPEATVEFGYGASSGQLASLTHTPSSGTAQVVSYSYDGSLVTGQTWSGMAVGDFLYGYDNNFFLTQTTLNSGSDSVVTSFTYDADGIPTGYGPFALTRGGPGGALSQVDDTALTMTIGYDTLARVQSRSQTVNGSSIYDFALTRDNVGRIVQKVETVDGVSNTYDYSYDAAGQLTYVTRDGSPVESYTYDANGNRLSTLTATASYDSQDRITDHGGVSYTFDDDGYLTNRGSDTFQYSARGELLSVTIGSNTITYDYDGLSRRVGRTDTSGTTQYLYGNPGNPFLVTAVRDPGGVLTTLYYDKEGLLFAMNRGGSMYYVATDQVGTPHVVADSTGTVVKVVEYDSFGKRISDSNPGFDLPFGFAGGLENTSTGLVRFGFRDFDQESGRWTARDPVLYDGGQANLYVYLGNDPVGLRDPLGLWCVGVSLYVGVGAGVQVCCNSGKCSVCAEGGFGIGGSASLGLGKAGKAKDTGNKVLGEAGAGCGPVGAGVKCGYDFKCGMDCNLEGSVGPLGVDSKGGVKLSHKLIKAETKCGYQAKLALEGCGQW